MTSELNLPKHVPSQSEPAQNSSQENTYIDILSEKQRWRGKSSPIRLMLSRVSLRIQRRTFSQKPWQRRDSTYSYIWALIGELILHDIISTLRYCHLNTLPIGRFKCSRCRNTAIHLVFKGSHRSLIKPSKGLRLQGQIKPTAYVLLGPTGRNLSHAWLAKSHFTLLASPEALWATTIRQTTPDPLQGARVCFQWHPISSFPMACSYYDKRRSDSTRRVTDWAIWGTVTLFCSRDLDLSFMVQEVGQHGSGAPQKPQVCALPSEVPQTERGPHHCLPSCLHQAHGARGQFYIEIIWRWEGFNNDPLQLPSPPHVSHFNLIINIWTGVSWNWQKEKSQAGINNASTKGK